MRAYEVIQRKQKGFENSSEEIRFMVEGALDGSVMEAQISAWFMAITFQGMSDSETWTLTECMRDSGRIFNLDGMPGVPVDKHSTGGVGDKLTFILAPILAAAGCCIPSITGRGLGHTGGTIDKLESVPGLNMTLEEEPMRAVLKKCGVALMGQTEDLVPADRLFYALRDVTATVESVPLICASILSKKLAESVKGLMLDVKCGSGAIFQNLKDARELAEALIGIAAKGKQPVAALLTDMNEPLGLQIGNWNELYESYESLLGYGPADLLEPSYALAASTLILVGLEKDLESAYATVCAQVDSGAAAERFLQMVEAQGGSREWFLAPHRAPKPSYGRTVLAQQAGYVHTINSRELGLLAVQLGAGRARKEDSVDYTAGITVHCKVGAYVRVGDPLCDIFSSQRSDLDELIPRAQEAWTVQEKMPVVKHSVASRPNGAAWEGRVIEVLGLPFTVEDWYDLIHKKGLGLKVNPLHAPHS
jgi:pyrimidine-nucleoside phosphorylase